MNLSADKIQEYHEPRQPGDFDLVNYVHQELVRVGCSNEKLAAFVNNHHIIAAKDRKPEVQRYHLNQYWNLQLLQADRPAINERFSLIPNGTIEDWCRLFSQVVLPFIQKTNIPV